MHTIKRPLPTKTERTVSSIDLIVSKGDREGNITYANPVFMKISGYSQGELLDKPHAILRHPDMPKVIFRYLWHNISKGKEVHAYVKNLCKDGSYYWVLARVRMAKNPDGSFRNYVSTRNHITAYAKTVITDLYAKMLKAEREKGMEASKKILEDFLSEKGHTNATFNTCMTALNREDH